jgi:hypothetical protein
VSDTSAAHVHTVHDPQRGRGRNRVARQHDGAHRWAPTVLLVRLAAFALAAGGAAWSIRWGWRALQGS